MDPEKFFDSLERKARRGNDPETYAHVACRARELHRASATPLSFEAKFYTYVLLNPLKPGPVSYELVGGKRVVFDFIPFYVGKGCRHRGSDHERSARKDPTPAKGQHKLNVIRKIHRAGLCPIQVRTSRRLEVEAVALAKEQLLINAIGRKDLGRGPLTNSSGGGDGATTGSFSEEVRNRISAAKLGQKYPKRTAEHQQKLTLTQVGLKRSDSVKAKISASRVGKGTAPRKPLTEEHKLAISAGKRGVPLSQEHREKLSAIRVGRRLSDETKRKISEANRGRVRTAEHKEKLRQANLGKTADASVRAKQSEALKGRPWSDARRAAYERSRSDN